MHVYLEDWKTVTEQEHWNQSYSQALGPADGQQQGHYEQEVANFLWPTGSQTRERWACGQKVGLLKNSLYAHFHLHAKMD